MNCRPQGHKLSMQIIWMPEAIQDLRSIQVYIARDSFIQSHSVIQSVVLFIEKQLSTFPTSGRLGRLPGTFELVVPKLPYFIPYRLHNNRIEILRVYHTSRLLPSSF